MSTIVTRAGKGSALTYNEVDSNFTNLNTDKYQSGGALGTPASGTLTNCTGYTYANLSGTVPTWNQDTTGNAATVTNGVYTSDIGTTVQAHSANLDEFATVNPTAAGLALLDDADAAAQRTTLGLGTAATTASTDYATAAQGTKADSALQSSSIGSTVQAYDSNLTSFVNTFTLPTTDGTSGQSLVTNGSGTLSFSSAGAGTVTSVDMTVPTGLSVSGNPVTTSGTLAVAYASGYAIPTTAKQTEWDSAYTQRLQWDGGATNLVAITGRASLLPSYTSNAGKVLAVNTGATDVEWISVGGSGTVTSVSGTGTVNGITLTGTVTSSGSLTLGGTLSGIGNAQLTNSSVTFNGQTVALGASGTITANTTNALTIGTGLSGTSFNGSGAVTIAIDSTVATLSGSQTLTNKTLTNPVINGFTGDTSVVNLGSGQLYKDTSGNVGIGTSSPSSRLTVGRVDSSNEGGQIDLCRASDNSSAWAIDVFGNTSTPSLRFVDNVAAASRIVIDNNGNVGINTSSPTSGYKLDVAGNFKVLGSIDENVYAVVDAAGVALSPQNGTIQTWTLGASRTPTLGTWNAGESMTLMINDGTAFTVTWTTMGIVWVGGTAPTLATSGYTVVELWRVGSTYYGALVGNVA